MAAALAAGGRLVNDSDAPSNWVLAGPEGNGACDGVACLSENVAARRDQAAG
ncbi:hypothetical protein GCM10023335_34600 [Streptomyces siamensis]|uniref:Uncharacterized protein n=1 Tax=Streptomyces siamensis TaxID=1274986 RepID=A0ABP9IW82_9ACTN